MATPAQMDEKPVAGTERYPPAEPVTATSEGPQFGDISISSQLAEKGRHDVDPSSSHPLPLLAGLATSAQLAEKRHPPPLPPRATSTCSSKPPPPYTTNDFERGRLISQQWRSHDPRSSSTHSLVPPDSAHDRRRTLLLVYIHGFMGNETSFQSFPAHIHNLLTITVAETHMVHTKIYPRYKSRKAIDFARDDFSAWLEPHENDHTEVILLGHSMGGILGAEVALQPSRRELSEKSFHHRILGTINFDTPFLGMHPGVVTSGIGSLFRPAPEPPKAMSPSASVYSAGSPPPQSDASASSYSLTPLISQSQTSSQLSLVQSITSPSDQPTTQDPYFNRPFPNDARSQERKGWSSVIHFINKHSDGLTTAAKQYVTSHLEFGGCLADYSGLQDRYKRLRELEDVDDITRRGPLTNQTRPTRVRFVNYYTASTGRPKPPKKSPESVANEDIRVTTSQVGSHSPSIAGSQSPINIPAMSLERREDSTSTPQPLEVISNTPPAKLEKDDLNSSSVQNYEDEPPEMKHIDSIPIEENDSAEPSTAIDTKALDASIKEATTSSEPLLPPIPDTPKEPDPIDLSIYIDKDSRKIAEKGHKRAVKAYQQAVKDRDNAIKDRRKLIEKRDKKARQDQEKQMKLEEQQRLKEEREDNETVTVASHKQSREVQESMGSSVKDDKPRRDRKFCLLPPKDGSGERDKCWSRVYMAGVDEVGAHCGLFFPGAHYEGLVGDVGARIEKWLEEDATRRAIIEAETS